ncbi:hypothetical protein TI39_contig282g00006 [Zymoseptoria brevis]|uniref:F-box domain-containing protein n=1 Tax=Zymoseptoria brevis TaxID=1047168 RepID=A0A0F4GZQ6_9PEZI|nr:hypothetical protein TI39_contig282g00006 [Zymoseptoria brevis]
MSTSPLLRIPPELRIQVYSHSTFDDLISHIQSAKICLSLLHTNRLIRTEYFSELYNNPRTSLWEHFPETSSWSKVEEVAAKADILPWASYAGIPAIEVDCLSDAQEAGETATGYSWRHGIRQGVLVYEYPGSHGFDSGPTREWLWWKNT